MSTLKTTPIVPRTFIVLPGYFLHTAIGGKVYQPGESMTVSTQEELEVVLTQLWKVHERPEEKKAAPPPPPASQPPPPPPAAEEKEVSSEQEATVSEDPKERAKATETKRKTRVK